ncbi:mariner Mos1 transposase [Trichonephila clavata]|uniref:Mariner Mos1 transposase n=1 Tax=Trichonephila clavata TaxID=2740835 RepID=A0A8X6KT80_TRICU|nr:mariner Mos1 transposase [Trichonephila clavata]
MKRNTKFGRKLSLEMEQGVTFCTGKQASEQAMETCDFTSTNEIKNTVYTSSGKTMMSFFDHKSPLFVEFQEWRTTINAKRYQAILQNLKRAIKSKCPSMLSNGVILLHDNAHLHTANAVKMTL